MQWLGMETGGSLRQGGEAPVQTKRVEASRETKRETVNGMGLSPLLLFSAGGWYQPSTSSKNQASNTNKQNLESGGKHSPNC